MKVFTVLVDSTDNGEYQNNAHCCVFADYESAKRYMLEDIDDTLANDFCVLELEEKRKELVTFYGENEAQYRRDDVIVDWKIESQSLDK